MSRKPHFTGLGFELPSDTRIENDETSQSHNGRLPNKPEIEFDEKPGTSHQESEEGSKVHVHAAGKQLN